jgi:hypothetical protein
MRLFHADVNTEAVQHDGVRYEPDEHGAFDLPHELAQRLLDGFPHLWTVAPQPEPLAAARSKPRRTAKPKPVEPVEPEDDTDADDPEDAAPTDETPSEEAVPDGDAPAPARKPRRAPSRQASA